MLCVRFEIRRAFDDQREHFILRYWNRAHVSLRILIAPYVRDTAAMREYLHDSNFLGVRVCGKNLSRVSLAMVRLPIALFFSASRSKNWSSLALSRVCA